MLLNAIESTLDLFKQICSLTESRIDSYFMSADQLENKSLLKQLAIHELATDVAGVLDLKQIDCLHAINLYMSYRPDLKMIGNNKTITIHRLSDEQAKMAMSPKECAMKHYDAVKMAAQEILARAFEQAEAELQSKGKSISQARLVKKTIESEISDKLNLKDYNVYHCLKAYIETERHDLVILLGRQGGIMKK